MKTARLLDSHALLAYYNGEPRGRRVAQALRGSAPLYLSLVNWGEMVYVLLRERGEDAAERCVAHLESQPVRVVAPDRTIIEEAARIKAATRLPYVDAICAATAVGLGASVLTGDPDFRAVESIVRIEWL